MAFINGKEILFSPTVIINREPSKSYSNALIDEKRGSSVVLDDLSPLTKDVSVTSFIATSQANGDPAPDNALPILPKLGISLNVSNATEGKEYLISFGQEVYGGTFNWETGILTIDTFIVKVNGVMYSDYVADHNLEYQGSWDQNKEMSADGYPCFVFPLRKELFPVVDTSRRKEAKCSHFINYHAKYDSNVQGASKKVVGFNGYSQQDAYNNYFYFKVNDTFLTSRGYSADTNGWCQYLKDIYAEGNPVQLAYKMYSPIKVKLTPRQVKALAGETTFVSDTGDTHVKYNRDINAAVDELRQAIISLGGNL